MAFSVSPTTVAPLGPFSASGTGTRKRPVRIAVSSADPVVPGKILDTFTIPANGRFGGRMLVAPPGPARTVTLILEQPRYSDGVWAQTASVKLVIAVPGGGGGTTPLPNDPPPGDSSAPIISGPSAAVTSTGATISWSL